MPAMALAPHVGGAAKGAVTENGNLEAAARQSDWPVYRHDVALSGVSPGKGKIAKPSVNWEYYLGAPFVPVATDREARPYHIADLDGDGQLEQFALQGKTIQVTDLA